MRKLFLLSLFVLIYYLPWAQTFNGNGGNIPDNNTISYFPVTVTGIGSISSSIGVSSVCINIDHPKIAQLEIYLKAPDGTIVPLSIRRGGGGSNYTGTCFIREAPTALEDGIAPFTGLFIPDGYLGSVNNGQDANGAWSLGIKDIAAGNAGSLLNWSLNFNTGLAPTAPECNGNMPPGNTCANATPVCSFYGFCSTTSSSYTADSWPGLSNEFCGTVQNNAFVKFIATGFEMNFNVWVTSSVDHSGIQMFFYDGGCGSGNVTTYGCYSPIRPGSSPAVVSATGLTEGNIYYLMIDGFAGDQCNYTIQPIPASGGLSVNATQSSVCLGKPVDLNALGGNGIYSWTGEGLNATTGSTVTAIPTQNSIYTVSSVDPGGLCPISKQIVVSVEALPDMPIVGDTLKYCQRAFANALTATGAGLLWYSVPTGGLGLAEMFPSTAVSGIRTYYVSQTIGCESQRTPLFVITKPGPVLGDDKKDTICFGTYADLTRNFNTSGLSTIWMFNQHTIASPVLVNSSGLYELIATNATGCTDTAIARLTVQQLVKVFAGNDTIAVKGQPFQLHASSASSWSWSPADLLNNPQLQNPLAIIQNDQQFIVKAADVAGCVATDTINLKIILGTTYYVPNAFTPNGDGLNDVFRAVPVGIRHTDYFRIMNRYGKTIFETSDPFNVGWDGSYLGSQQSSGSYVWFIKGTDINGKKIAMKGTLVLIQ